METQNRKFAFMWKRTIVLDAILDGKYEVPPAVKMKMI